MKIFDPTNSKVMMNERLQPRGDGRHQATRPARIAQGHGIGDDRVVGGQAHVVIASDPDSRPTIELVGNFDLSAVGEVHAAFDQLDPGCTAVLLDMSELDFIDSTGVGALITAHKAGIAIRIVGAPNRVQRSFDTLGLSDVFEMVGD